MKFSLKIFVAFVALSIFLISCRTSDDPVTPPSVNELEGLIKVKEFSNDTHTIELYTATGTTQLGYNDLKFNRDQFGRQKNTPWDIPTPDTRLSICSVRVGGDTQEEADTMVVIFFNVEGNTESQAKVAEELKAVSQSILDKRSSSLSIAEVYPELEIPQTHLYCQNNWYPLYNNTATL